MITVVSSTLRFFKLIFFIITYRLDKLILPSGSTDKKNLAKLNECLEKMGPIFIKLGQLASTRKDMLGEDVTLKLSALKDQASSFDSKAAIQIIEKNIKANINTVFSEFNETPIGSASVAQVHTAKLHTGEEIVIKLLRPGITKTIKQDLNIAKILAKISSFFSKRARKLKLLQFVMEFENSILQELNLKREAVNAIQLKRTLSELSFVKIPKIYLNHSYTNMLVMERMHGVNISNIKLLESDNVNLKLLAERVTELLFSSAFKHGIFQADMHSGNILVDPSNPQSPNIILLDFGIIGTLNYTDQKYLTENFAALFKKDYHKVAELHVKSNWLKEDVNLDHFANEIRVIYEPLSEIPLEHLSIANSLMELIKVAKKFSINLQPQFLLLQKSMYQIEGIVRQLEPNINLVEISKPILNNWLKSKVSYKTAIQEIHAKLPFWIEKLPGLPEELHETIIEIKKINRTLEDSKKNSVSRYIINYLASAIIGFLIAILLILIFQYTCIV